MNENKDYIDGVIDALRCAWARLSELFYDEKDFSYETICDMLDIELEECIRFLEDKYGKIPTENNNK